MSLCVLNYRYEFSYFTEIWIKVAKESYFNVNFRIANQKSKAFFSKKNWSKIDFIYIFGKVCSLSFRWGTKLKYISFLSMLFNSSCVGIIFLILINIVKKSIVRQRYKKRDNFLSLFLLNIKILIISILLNQMF